MEPRLVPVLARWRWAQLLSRAHLSDFAKPDEWPEVPSVGWSMAYWVTLVAGCRPFATEHALLCRSWTRRHPITAVVWATAGVVFLGVLRSYRPVSAWALTLPIYAVGVVLIEHAVRTWRLPTRAAYVTNIVRYPDAPDGSGDLLMLWLCGRADAYGYALALRTRVPALVEYYQRYGFVVHRQGGQTLMYRPQQPLEDVYDPRRMKRREICENQAGSMRWDPCEASTTQAA